MTDLMIDIETMGNKSFAAIVSIAAVEFDITTGETGNEFYENVSLDSCLQSGLKVDASTVLWWMQQSEDARTKFVQSPIHLAEALQKFTFFCKPNLAVWGNSNRFDLGILENAYSVLSLSIPWKFWNERDVRTLVSFRPEIKDEHVFVGTPHNALDDCHNQIQYCHKIWKSI